MIWIGWLVAASVAVGLGVLLWRAQTQLAQARAALGRAEREHAQELGDTRASATRQLRAQKADARHAVQGIATDILAVADGMDRAAAQENGDVEAWRQGVIMVRQCLEHTLGQHGVHPVDVGPGDDFEPECQECITELPAVGDGGLTIVEVQRRGWRLHDRLLRPAEVVVQRGVGVAARDGGAASGRDSDQADGLIEDGWGAMLNEQPDANGYAAPGDDPPDVTDASLVVDDPPDATGAAALVVDEQPGAAALVADDNLEAASDATLAADDHGERCSSGEPAEVEEARQPAVVEA